MYIPTAFAQTDPHRLHELIEQQSFATLVSRDGEELFANHLPLLLDQHAGPHGRLLGHMARANPQWKSADGRDVLAIFHGPHAYISPSWYRAANVVPTWNYVAVHVYGVLRVVTDSGRLREIVDRTVAFYEAALPAPWSPDGADPEFIEKLLQAIVGFEIDVARIEGKWKLGQNHDEPRRERVIAALRQTGSPEDASLADLMARTLTLS
jgi:transcriptional regulator